jgi:hypothetical protein
MIYQKEKKWKNRKLSIDQQKNREETFYNKRFITKSFYNYNHLLYLFSSKSIDQVP